MIENSINNNCIKHEGKVNMSHLSEHRAWWLVGLFTGVLGAFKGFVASVIDEDKQFILRGPFLVATIYTMTMIIQFRPDERRAAGLAMPFIGIGPLAIMAAKLTISESIEVGVSFGVGAIAALLSGIGGGISSIMGMVALLGTIGVGVGAVLVAELGEGVEAEVLGLAKAALKEMAEVAVALALGVFGVLIFQKANQVLEAKPSIAVPASALASRRVVDSSVGRAPEGDAPGVSLPRRRPGSRA